MISRRCSINLFTLAMCAPTLFFMNGFASAALIVNDTWQDAERTQQEAGSDTDSDTDIESAWYRAGAVAMSNTVGNLRSDLNGNSANMTTYFTAEGSEINLANNGDKLRVTWQFVPTGVAAANTSQNFRIGLVDSPAANRSVVDGTAPGNDTLANQYRGYAIFANMATPTLGGSTPFQLRQKSLTNHSGSNSILGTTADWDAGGEMTGTLNGATGGNGGFTGGETYTLVWELTRNGAGIDVNVTMTGTGYNTSGSGVITANDPTGNGYAFDTFNIRPASEAGVADILDTKLFRVEFEPIPEPAALVLVGLGCLALAAVRRRG